MGGGPRPDPVRGTPQKPTHWYNVTHFGERYHYGTTPEGVITAGPSSLLGKMHGFHGTYPGAPQVTYAGDREPVGPSSAPRHPLFIQSRTPGGLVRGAATYHRTRQRSPEWNQAYLATHEGAFHQATLQAKDAHPRGRGILARLGQLTADPFSLPLTLHDQTAAGDLARQVAGEVPDHQKRLLHAAGVRLHVTSGHPDWVTRGTYWRGPDSHPIGSYQGASGVMALSLPPGTRTNPARQLLHHEIGHAMSHIGGHVMGYPDSHVVNVQPDEDEYGARLLSNHPAWRDLYEQHKDHPAIWKYLRSSPEEFYAGMHAAYHQPGHWGQRQNLSHDLLEGTLPRVHEFLGDHDATFRRLVAEHTPRP
jgi:hypothetical protein